MNQPDLTTNSWGPIPGGVNEYAYGEGYISLPGQFAFDITEPGYWEFVFSFSVEGASNNTTVELREVTDQGAGPAITWIIRQATNSVSGSISVMAEITQAEIDAPGQVYLQVERNISHSCTWLFSELTIWKNGSTVPT